MPRFYKRHIYCASPRAQCVRRAALPTLISCSFICSRLRLIFRSNLIIEISAIKRFQLNERPAVGSQCAVTVLLRNPLPSVLRAGRFFVEGAGLTDSLELACSYAF